MKLLLDYVKEQDLFIKPKGYGEEFDIETLTEEERKELQSAIISRIEQMRKAMSKDSKVVH